jgi:hypothetical protein
MKSMVTALPESRTPDDDNDYETLALRRMSKTLSLWGVCTHRACRRARACRGNPRDCLPRYSPLVPEDARAGADAMAEGWRFDLSFEEVLEEAPDEVKALDAWGRAVIASANRPRVRRKRAGTKPADR